jgi:hypothetical protein
MSEKARMIFIDLETAPSLGFSWGPKYETSVIEYKKDWYLLAYSYKVAGESKVYTKCLADYPGYRKDLENDELLVNDLWKIFDEADILVAHNGDSFDVRKANTRFVTHGLPPPSTFKTVDTLKIARKVFRFDSNKLDDLAKYLGVGRKLPTTGAHLWFRCMAGDLKAWRLMRRYNAQDLVLLEKVYYLLRSWSPTHPQVNKGQHGACPKCGSINIQKRGLSYTLLRQKQRFQCLSCRGWFEGSAKKAESFNG